MIEAVKSRLEAQVPELAHRVEGAAQFAALMKSNALPQHTPAAHVLPLGLQGGRADAMAGAFTQELQEAIGVILTLRSQSQTGDKALDPVNTLVRAIIAALAGWAPNDETGVFRLLRGNLISMSAGTIVYQLDFTITDQLRILS